MKKLSNFSFRLFLMACLLAFPIAINAQTVSLSFKNVPLKTVLKSISAQTDCKFVYSESVINTAQNVSIETKGEMPAILEQVFKGTGISYKVVDKQIVLSKEIKVQQTKKSKVSGLVTDEAGAPLPGVTVSDGHGTYSVTDGQGHYSIEVDPSSELTYACLGQETRSFQVSGRSTIDVVLGTDFQMLDNAIVTGYQTLSRERTAGSFNVVKGDVVASKVGLTGNILQSLEGVATGLSVNYSDGADALTIRGITSINSNRTPLYVVDGVPLEASQVEALLNGNEIGNISILKDATAASIWGSQAANGVIVITTKRGQKSDKLNISFSSSFTYTGKPDYSYQNLMNGETFMRNAQEMFDQYSDIYKYDSAKTAVAGLFDRTIPTIFPHERLMYRYKEGEISQSELNSGLAALIAQNGRESYEKYFMSDKLMTRHSVSVSGGSDKHNYYISVGYVGNQGIAKDWNNRVSFTVTEDVNITPWLKWDVTINASYNSERGHLTPWYDISDKMYSNYTKFCNLPYATFFNADGSKIDWSVYAMSDEYRKSIESLIGSVLSFYPTDDFQNSIHRIKGTNLRVNTGLNINIIDGLSFEGRVQYSRFHGKQERFYSQDAWKVREEVLASTPKNTLKPWLPTSGGNYYSDINTVIDWTTRAQLQYVKSFNADRHQITALAGTEVRKYTYENVNNFMRGYDWQTMQYTAYDVFNLNRVSGAIYGTGMNTFYKTYYEQKENDRRYFSVYANVAYTFLSRYSINASIRMDQSNLFGSNPENQFKPIWAVGMSWKISDETWMKDANWLNRLNLRATYGFAGNSPQPGQGGNYDILTGTTSSFYETTGLQIVTPANDRITWEKTRTVNVGVDSDFLKGRIGFTADYYHKLSSDLIATMLLNPASGWASTIGNVGSLKNTGIELSLNAVPVKAPNFEWYTMLTFSYNDNRIIKLDVESPFTASTLTAYSTSYQVEGYPVNSLFSYRYAGLNDKGEPQVYDKSGNIVSGVASNALGAEDVVYSGTIVPKFFGGWTNTLRFKEWELGFMFIYNAGNKMRRQCEVFNYGRTGNNLLNDFDKRWRKPGDESITDIPLWSPSKDANANYSLYYYSDRNILDASFVKLRDVSLTYNIPTMLCHKASMQAASVKLSVGNLFLIAANKDGIDPEYYSLASYSGNRTDKFGPSYSIELNIRF